MEPMNTQEFNNKLDVIVDETIKQLNALVQEAYSREGKDMSNCEPISFRYEWNFNDESIDRLITAGGWVHDRLNGMTRLNRKSLTKKLRKALGYNIP